MAGSLSDNAMSVLAFAIYHQLESGEPVTAVVRRDGSGHQANDEALKELEQAGLVTAESERVLFSDRGQETIRSLIEAMRRQLQ
jgi:ribosomal protein S19E (S16A)